MKSKNTAAKIPRREAPELSVMKATLRLMGVAFQEEYKFHPTRRWRFDIAILDPNSGLKIAIEYDGIMSTKSRHTSVTGFSKDCEKTNAAAVLGWRVLRYTVLNHKQFYADIKEMLGQ